MLIFFQEFVKMFKKFLKISKKFWLELRLEFRLEFLLDFLLEFRGEFLLEFLLEFRFWKKMSLPLKSLQTWPRSGNKEWLLSSLQKLTQIYLLETSQNLNLRLNIWIEECFWPVLSNLKNGYDKISTLEHLTKLFITLDWDCNIEL